MSTKPVCASLVLCALLTVPCWAQDNYVCMYDIGASLDYDKAGNVTVTQGYFYREPGGGAFLAHTPGGEGGNWTLVALDTSGKPTGSARVLFLKTPDGAFSFTEYTPSGVSTITLFVNAPSSTPQYIPMSLTRTMVLGGTPLVTVFSGGCRVAKE